jgi:iron complex outermembrane receptor protein
LRTEPGVVVRDFFGNGSKAAVDIRGFGEQAAQNVLVLVDGRRVNQMDLSGTDWTQIPVEQIERIEILRGGGGSVLYGDNASSGTINIITKSGAGKPSLHLEGSYGSYDLNTQKAAFEGETKGLSYVLTGSREATHGYRDNSYFKSGDTSAKLSYQVPDTDLLLRFRAGLHKPESGYPGALSSAALAAENRRFSSFPDDYSKGTDYHYAYGFDKGLGGWGQFSFDGSWRTETAYTNFVGANSGFNPILEKEVHTVGFTPKVVIDKAVLGHANTLVAGFDFYRSDYKTDNFDTNDVIQNFIAVNKLTRGAYFQDKFSLWPRLHAVAGYRYESAKYEFDYEDYAAFFANAPVDQDRPTMGRAYNFGLVLEHMKNSELFVTFNQSYRLPVGDEFFSYGIPNFTLLPQESRNLEAGIRQRITDALRASLTLYRMNVKDEIFFNPIGGPFGFGQNQNYDETVHRGLETGLEAKPWRWLRLFGNYTLTDAQFAGGVFSGKNVPMVPSNKWTAGAGLKFGSLGINTAATFVGDRQFINDEANRYPALKDYFTLDANVSYDFGMLTLIVGVNNILDQQYSEYGVRSAATGAYNLYPSPGANYYLKGKIDI